MQSIFLYNDKAYNERHSMNFKPVKHKNDFNENETHFTKIFEISLVLLAEPKLTFIPV